MNITENITLHLQGKNIKILIAEDDESSHFLLSLILKEISQEMIHARTGLEAVELCRANPDIDLILMDVKMPIYSGYEATQHIRKFNSDVIIIAQTAYGLSGDREKAISVGCNDYISKPIMKDILLSTIKRYFSE
ncbi:response regulator [Maribacter antarcticus]|uniref:response regulator n=1 Tax=Maribacter antarcticus TaxID=505250 RepID=UPI000684B9BD|nr:response regulator [Maribacter antarcticus]